MEPTSPTHELQATIVRQRTYLADVSHELRSPLTVLDLRLQALQQYRDLPPDVAGELERLRSTVNDMVEVVHELLMATYEDQVTDGATVSDVRAVADEVGDSLSTRASRGHLDLLVDIGPGVFATIASTSLRRCLVALVDNAIKHTPPGGFVVIRGWDDSPHVVIEVSDSGTGIQPELLARVFERNVTESGRGGPTGGFGIGLALVHDLVTRNGGDIEVAESSESGTTIRVRVPSTRPA